MKSIPIRSIIGVLLLLIAGENASQASSTITYEAFLPIALQEKFVYIPAGEFLMGCAHGNYCESNNLPLHLVYLDAYYIDWTEVTISQYARCVEGGACSAPSQFWSITRADYYTDPDFADYPVLFVDWVQADTYCHWIGGRLPTEAEWEKAARGGLADTRIYPWGNGDPDCLLANHKFPQGPVYVFCEGDTNKVGSYPDGASPYGVLDMAGNVWEWVNDTYQWDYYSISPYKNPPGPASGPEKVLRGGSWNSFWTYLHVAHRGHSLQTIYPWETGFRCAYTP